METQIQGEFRKKSNKDKSRIKVIMLRHSTSYNGKPVDMKIINSNQAKDLHKVKTG